MPAMDATAGYYELKQRQWAEEKALVVWVTLALYATFAFRVWTLPVPPVPVSGLLLYCAACLGLVAWRRSPWRPSYQRHRELAAALLRVLGTGLGSWPAMTGQMLSTWPPLAAAPLPAYVALLMFASGGPSCLHFALALKMRFWLSMVTQTILVSSIIPFHASYCAVPALSTPDATGAIHRIYGALSHLAYILPFPASSFVKADPQAECATVLTWLHLTLGLLLPLTWEARAETAQFLRHQRLRQRAGLPPERGLHATLFRALGWIWADGQGVPFSAMLAVLLALAWDWVAFFSVPKDARQLDENALATGPPPVGATG